MVMLSVLNNPVLTLQLGILGKFLGLMGRIVKGSLAQVSCILMYVYVAPPTPVGAWSMALGLRQRLEYYYYYYYYACHRYVCLILSFPQILKNMCSLYNVSYLEAEAEYNVAKNRFSVKLPSM